MARAPEDWQRVDEVFDAVADARKGERTKILNRLCADNYALRMEVEELLAADEAGRDFLEHPITQLPPEFSDLCRDQVTVGKRIGAYEIVRELGRGGLGVVYLAARADEQFEKTVAIKLIKRGLDTDEVQRRFRTERQILATLEHPNISRLLDAGTTPDGLSYFVMEYVEGEPITQYCDAQRLDIPERLQLFCAVCGAVSYAQQRLVIHRDLKPSNILVTAEGTPKLLDFGIAKLLDTNEQPERTTLPQRVLTPEYASPEQLCGEAMTTASDVYSLGIVLHELLTGAKPKRAAHGETERPTTAAAHHQPPTANHAAKSLHGDLGNIVFKALRDEPARRYPSARALHEDIQRYLRGLPVQARPDAFAYRAGKFVRRHRLGVAAATLLFLTLIGGLAATAWQAGATAREKARAESINRFLVQMLNDTNPILNSALERGDDTTVREMLDQAASKLPGENFAHHPEERADLEKIIAQSYGARGLSRLALEHDRQFVALESSLPHESRARRALAEAGRAGILFGQGNLVQAEKVFRQALPVMRAEYEKGNVTAADLSQTLDNFAYLRRTQGDSVEAGTLFREALSRIESIPPSSRGIMATTRSTLASTIADLGKFNEAFATAREAVSEYERNGLTNTPAHAFALTILGGFEAENAQFAEADRNLAQAESILRKRMTSSNLWLGDALRNEASSFCAQGRYGEALTKAQEALTIYGAAFGPHYDTYPTALEIEGLSFAHLGRLDRGEKLLREALQLRTDSLPPEHFWVALAKSTLGECLTLEKGFTEAEPLLVSSYRSLQRSQGNDNPRTRVARQRLAQLYIDTGRPELATNLRATSQR
jgi:serine/threonine-protein kinase